MPETWFSTPELGLGSSSLHNLRKKPLAWVVLPQDSDYGRRKLWFDLFDSPKGGQYKYVQESRFVDGESWMNKGGTVIPLDMLTDFVANVHKIAVKSDEFKPLSAGCRRAEEIP